MRKQSWVALVLIVLASCAAVAQQPVIVLHDPWLNWDFINNTGQMVNDFHIIVESPDWTPPEVFYSVYPSFNVVHGDNNGDGIPDTMLTWADAAIMPGMPTHVGAYMLGSGRVLDAYWTLDGARVASALPITYELTEIYDPDPTVLDNSEIHMLLQFAPGYYADPGNAGEAVGWTNIRTFASIPANMLGLADLNEGLDLGLLLPFEVAAREGGPAGDLISSDRIIWGDGFGESFFDVYFDIPVPDGMLGPQFESLLVADIVNGQGDVIARFWNLNPQCPEPGTYALIAAGVGALLLRFRRKR
jgi:hypothetical protein